MADPLDRDRSIEHLLRQTLHASTAATACLDAEQLAAWVAGGLVQAEATAVEQHLVDCAHCQAMLAAFVESEPAPVVDASPVVLPFRRRWRATWLVPAAAAAAAVLVWVAVTREPTERPLLVTTMARVEEPSQSPPAEVTGIPGVIQQSREAPTSVEPPVPVEPRLQAGRRQEQNVSPSEATNQERQESAADLALPPPVVSRRFAVGAVQLPSVAAAGPASSVSPAVPPPASPSSPAPSSTESSPAPPPEPAAAAERTSGVTAASPGSAGASAFRADAASTSRSTTATAVRADMPAHVQRSGPRAVEFSAPTAGATTQETALSARPVRWRLEVTGGVSRSADGGVSWGAVVLPPSTFITAGSAPVPGVCWLVGRNGTVFRSTDDATFAPVAVPEAGAVAAIQARDASTATVTVAGGRVFSTTDGGRSWRVLP